MDNRLVMIQPEEFKEEFKTELLEELANMLDEKLGQQSSQPDKPIEKYMTRSEVCDMLKMSLPTVDQLAKEGILKAHKIKNRVLFIRSEVEQAVEKKTLTKKKRRFNDGFNI
jgi:excisionase family DNA binding protein